MVDMKRTINFETIHFHHQKSLFTEFEFVALFIEFWCKENSHRSTGLRCLIIGHFDCVREWNVLQVTESEMRLSNLGKYFFNVMC